MTPHEEIIEAMSGSTEALNMIYLAVFATVVYNRKAIQGSMKHIDPDNGDCANRVKILCEYAHYILQLNNI